MELNLKALLDYYIKLNGYNINQLSDLSGVSQSYLSDLVSGKKVNPGILRLEMIADALGISLSEFFIPIDQKEKDKTLDERVSSLPANKRKLIEDMVEEFENN